MRHRYISYFAGIFLLAFFAVLNTGVLISVSGFQRLQNRWYLSLIFAGSLFLKPCRFI